MNSVYGRYPARLEQTDAEQAVKADLYNIWHAYQNNLQMLDLEEERLLAAEYNTKLCEISLMQISGKVSVYLQ